MSCADFKAQFPSSNLEDNVCSKEGGFVSTGVSSQQKVDPFIVYTRRPKDKSSPTASMPSGSGGEVVSCEEEWWESAAGDDEGAEPEEDAVPVLVTAVGSGGERLVVGLDDVPVFGLKDSLERWEGVSSHLGDQTCGLVLAHWNGAAGMTPFEGVYGRKPPGIQQHLHPVFHVSLLKRAIGDHPTITDLPVDLVSEEVEFRLSDILQVVRQSGQGAACHRVLVA
ncbi:hypothetical protein V2J09_017371 [Rumex salicifolius]